MKKIFLLFIAFALISCQKQDEPSTSRQSFSFAGIKFETFSKAFDAAVAASPEGAAIIRLCEDYSGEGASIKDYNKNQIILDLGPYTYTLEDGASIDVEGSLLTINGNGGAIVSGGNKPIINSESSRITFSGNFILSGENIIRSSSTIETDRTFTGTVNGNIQLDSASFVLKSSACSVSIPVLTANGQEAAFVSKTFDIPSAPVVSIGKVISDQKYPVMAVCNGIIADGCDTHIHNFTRKHIDGSCISQEMDVLVCSECECEIVDESTIGSYGSCNPSDFVYHKRVEAGDFTFGNVEYWECPFCGKCYSDSKGENEISDSIFLFPTSWWQYNKEITKVISDAEGSENSVAVLFTVISVAYTLYSTIRGIITSNKLDFDQLNRQLDEVSGKIDNISAQLNNLATTVRMITNKKIILDRTEDISSLSAAVIMAKASIDSVKTLYPAQKDSVKLKEEICKIVSDWSDMEVGRTHMKTFELTKYLLDNYFTLTNDYHDIYKEFANSLCLWEHESFPLVECQSAYDGLTLAISSSLARIYYNDVAKFSTETLRKQTVAALDSSYNHYIRASKSSHELDSTSNANYRILLKGPSQTQVKFDKVITGPYNFYDTYRKHTGEYKFHRNNSDNCGVNSCNKLLTHMSQEQNFRSTDLMTADEVKLLLQIYNTSKPIKYSINNILLDDCKFKLAANDSAQFVKGRVLPERNDGYRKSGNPTYKIFFWHVEFTGSDDNIGVFAVGGWDNQPHYGFQFARNCRIAYYSGKIKETGYDTGERFYTVRHAVK